MHSFTKGIRWILTPNPRADPPGSGHGFGRFVWGAFFFSGRPIRSLAGDIFDGWPVGRRFSLRRDRALVSHCSAFARGPWLAPPDEPIAQHDQGARFFALAVRVNLYGDGAIGVAWHYAMAGCMDLIRELVAWPSRAYIPRVCKAYSWQHLGPSRSGHIQQSAGSKLTWESA